MEKCKIEMEDTAIVDIIIAAAVVLMNDSA
jgi:hypothetical protein